MKMKRTSSKNLVAVLAMLLCLMALTACGKGAKETAGSVSEVADQYYLNDKLMIEMLINNDVTVKDAADGFVIGTKTGKTSMSVNFRPGIQNLNAAGDMLRDAVKQAHPKAQLEEMQDSSLFGVRAKSCRFAFAADKEGETFKGTAAAAIVNQSFYNLILIIDPQASQNEIQLMNKVMASINILRPAAVDEGSKTAKYESQYQEKIQKKEVKPAPKSSKKQVSEWDMLPYAYYSWWSDPGDYYDYPSWYFEPDWDYYGDYDYYWDWGWDSDDWWFYDEYGDYYDWDYYQDFDDYWYNYEYDWDDYDYYDWWDDDGWWDDYDPWSDPGDYYDEYDYYDYYDDYDFDVYDSDPGDYYDYYDSYDYYDDWTTPYDYGYDDWYD